MDTHVELGLQVHVYILLWTRTQGGTKLVSLCFCCPGYTRMDANLMSTSICIHGQRVHSPSHVGCTYTQHLTHSASHSHISLHTSSHTHITSHSHPLPHTHTPHLTLIPTAPLQPRTPLPAPAAEKRLTWFPFDLEDPRSQNWFSPPPFSTNVLY